MVWRVQVETLILTCVNVSPGKCYCCDMFPLWSGHVGLNWDNCGCLRCCEMVPTVLQVYWTRIEDALLPPVL
jgi:hypothetical protein